MKKDDIVMIPFVAHESAMNRMERANRRLIIIIAIMLIGIFVYLIIPNEVIDENTQDVSDINSSEINQSIGD